MKYITTILGILLLFSCNKANQGISKYFCQANCTDLTINLKLSDTNRNANTSYITPTEYKIYFYKQASGLFSEPVSEFIKSGKLNSKNALKEIITIDKGKLNTNDYSVYVRFTAPQNLSTCLSNPFNYYISNYPNSGNIDDSIIVYRNITKSVKIIKTSTDTFKRGKFYISGLCFGSNVEINNPKLNEEIILSSKLNVNSMAYFRIRKFLDIGGYIDKVDSVFITDNFKGKTIEY